MIYLVLPNRFLKLGSILFLDQLYGSLPSKRHAPVNLESTVCYGQLNVQTDSTFDDVCLSLTSLFKKLENSKVYSSPLNRCALMAQYFFDEFSVVNDLMEINFGDWEGIPWDHIPRIEIDKWVDDISDFKPNNGESLREMHHTGCKIRESCNITIIKSL